MASAKYQKICILKAISCVGIAGYEHISGVDWHSSEMASFLAITDISY
jgi:hypothetical protein